ncbi:MAG: T9SS type A sorting domain-containing protein [Bacteroidales bacterium]|nr:T9SS type A sorting domain-containing protein [Bacteroidales bacterium]
MKKIFLFQLFIMFFYCANAQFAKFLEFNGTNGSSPCDAPTLKDSIFYGMTSQGGANDLGLIYRININGTNYAKLLDFNGTNNGSFPTGYFTLKDTDMYGMAYGGINNKGVIFKIKTDGTGYSKLFDFNGTNGATPGSALTFISDTVMCGTTEVGGINNEGVLFKIKTDGTGFTKLIDFGNIDTGSFPKGALILSGNILYGVTANGGSPGPGTIYKINTDGSNFTQILDFNPVSKGSYPNYSIILHNGTLFGMTLHGGTNDKGVIFKVRTDGSSYTKLLDFDDVNNGSYPLSSFVLDGSYLYGTTNSSSTLNNGILFKIDTNGTGFVKLFEFDGINKGNSPFGRLILNNNILYGAANEGGANNKGLIFKYGLSNDIKEIKTTNPKYNIYQINSEVFFESDEIIKNINIYDINGKLLNSYIVNNKNYSINTNKFAKGIYISNATTGNTTHTSKITIK